MDCEKFGFDLFDHNYDTYEEIRDEFEWSVPSPFNAATYLVDRWANSDRANRVALYYEDHTTDRRGELTYSSLAKRSNQFANYLQTIGIKPGDRVAVNTPRKPETLIAHLGIWKIGAISLPLSTLFGPEALRYRLEDSSATVCLADGTNIEALRKTRESLPSLEQVLVLNDTEGRVEEKEFSTAIEAQRDDFDTAESDPDDPMVLMYTSGTTGSPKGVIQNHEAVAGHVPGAVATAYNFDIRDDEVFWSPVEWSWAGTLTLIIISLFFGRALVAYEANEKFDPEAAFELLEQYDITLLRIPPSALRMMQTVENIDQYDIESVRLVSSGGESPGEELCEWTRQTFDAQFHEAFGQTEMWNLVLGDCTAFKSAKDGWIGFPLPGHDVEIVDPETAESIGPGKVGEIALRKDDPIVFEEYLGKPKKTAAKFSGDWVLTEDLGERDAEGRFRYISRKDDVIICSGHKVGPEEVEDAVAAHKAVVDAGVIGLPDETRGSVPKAFVCLAAGYEPSSELKEEIQTFVRDQLAAFEYPREIEFINELPRTTTGKTRRETLREWQGLVE
jgi:acetyl-CoA synthetase